ncbi:MAG TPA: hypothetical protein DCW68_02260 [Rhodospirillaceae bacterium]|nr:MAG: hypothetical protein A2018_05230 [Alphaproteobacteria bacterium GWF2_58_20]HAU28917.1 hypothetical protein [Rhodospirillaceae bacterium]
MTPIAVDFIVLGILLVSALVSFARGFAHEVLTYGAFIGSVFVMLLGVPFVQPYMMEIISTEWIAAIASGAVLFVASMVIFTMIIHRISDAIHKTSLSGLDRTLGFGIGVLRGALIVCLIYLPLAWLWPQEKQPSWLMQAKTRPFVVAGAELLKGMVPTNAPSSEKPIQLLPEKTQIEAPTAQDPVSQLPPVSEGGYSDPDRLEMDGLVDETLPPEDDNAW